MQNRVLRYAGLIFAAQVFVILPASVAFGLQNASGLVVEELARDSPAVKAGLQLGDRIVSYDKNPLASPAALEAVQQNASGKKNVLLEVLRGEEKLSVIVPLGGLGSRTPNPSAERQTHGARSCRGRQRD